MKNNLFFLFSDSDVNEFVLQIGRTINIYQIDFIEDKPDDVLKTEAEEADNVKDEEEEDGASDQDD